MRYNFFLVCLAVVILVSCREPRSSERFIRSQGGPYQYELNVKDTLRRYDFTFYTRIDAKDSLLALPLNVEWTSPSGENFAETVYIPVPGGCTPADVEAPYRRGVTFPETGQWTMNASLPEGISIRGLRGLGLIISHEDGPR